MYTQRDYRTQATWRTIARTDPREAHELWASRHAYGVEQYLSGATSRAVFGATLYGLGYRNSELTNELAHYDRVKYEQQQDNGGTDGQPKR